MRCVVNSRAFPGFDYRLALSFNLPALRNKETVSRYKVSVANRFATLENMMEGQDLMLTTFGKNERMKKLRLRDNWTDNQKKTRKPCISEEALQLMDKRRKLRGNKNRGEKD